nr:G-type lectin S-receptor-like serine/threonine-protein kinase LECRK3 [Tanacetum cinerariifolium]
VAQQTNGSVPVGSSLTTTDNAIPWLSPSGDFAFGFQRIRGKDNYVLSIWYDKIPDKTIISYPQGNSMVSRGSKVELLNGSGLVLTDPQGTRVWSSMSVSNLAYGIMNDTGNFVLVGSDSRNIWESFDSFADTMLPTQVMARGGLLYILKRNGKSSELTPRDALPSGDYYHRATLGFDGVFTQYYHPKNSDGITSWSILWLEPENICQDIISDEGSGAGGFYSVCSLNGARRPNCECPPGLSLIDSCDPYGDCKLNFIPSCEEELTYSGEIDFMELTSIDWPQSDYVHMESTSKQEQSENIHNHRIIPLRNTPVIMMVDVYSYGVLLLEIVTCRKSVKEFRSGDEYGEILTD